MVTAYRSTVAWIDGALASLTEAVERMTDQQLLDEHEAARTDAPSAVGQMVSQFLDRELQRRKQEASR
jgi:hypothetical protein